MKAFVNATFLSCEEENRVFSVLVEDRGRIVFTGDELPQRYLDLPKVDLGGVTVVPAFADTHMRRVVVLPQPLGPSSVTNDPGRMSRDTSFTA